MAKKITIQSKDKSKQNKFIKVLLDEVARGAKERENKSKISVGTAEAREAVDQKDGGASDNVWDLGEYLWEDSTRHLPANWTSTTCPKLLNLKTVPVFNYFKALAKQVQDGVVGSAPDLDFTAEVEPGTPLGDFVDDFELTEWLNEEWRKCAESSRILAEAKKDVKHNWLWGIGWWVIAESQPGKKRVQAVDPRLVVWDPDADHPSDIKWVAKLFAERVGKEEVEKAVEADEEFIFNMASIPTSIVSKKDQENTELKVELWVRKGAKIGSEKHGSLTFEQSGTHLIITSTMKVKLEEDWDSDALPLLPSTLNPDEGLWGEAMTCVLWNAQVDLEKVYAKYCTVVARAGDDKYHVRLTTPVEPGEGVAAAAMGPNTVASELVDPGTQVYMSNSDVELLNKDHPGLPELREAFYDAIERMNRLSGITDSFQGIKQPGADSGVAIQSLAALSGKLIQNWATNLAAGLREVGRVWAQMKLSERGVVVDSDSIDVKVTLIANEEITRERMIDDIQRLVEMSGAPAPMDILVDLMPRLDEEYKERLKEHFAQYQPGMEPEAIPGAPAVGGYPIEPEADMVSAPMAESGALLSDMNAPDVQ